MCHNTLQRAERMETLPLVTTGRKLASGISKLLKSGSCRISGLTKLDDTQKALDFLYINMPELIAVDFSDKKSGAFMLLDRMLSDPWLLHGGIIALCRDYETVKQIEKIQGANIIVIIQFGDLDRQLLKVLSIIDNNRRILFQREIGSDIVRNISGSFKLNNDTVEVQCYVNLICNFLYNANKLDIGRKNDLRLALIEMLQNAIEHGNCGISYRDKTDWLEKNANIDELIEIKNRNPGIKRKKVTFEYTIAGSCSKFFIADEGEGFDWREKIKGPGRENLLDLHGRGIMMTRLVTKNLRYNEKGNEVSFEITHQEETAITPGLFNDIRPKNIEAGDLIFRQGEASDFIYYIVKGTYDVIVNEKVVSSLSPDDVFMGEMSFLLNNQRSATVKARSRGQLIVVSKKQFVEAIKEKPHYALFLSRLLAQRIQRLNIKSASK